MQKIVSIIHARGGSKRIPLKNIQKINNIPLIAFPIKLSQSISDISRVIVSTDNQDIKEIALSYGAEVPFTRPPDISEDVASELVTDHAIKFLIKEENFTPDIAITLTPCHPFTKASHIKEGLELLKKNDDWDSVVTVKNLSEYPQWMVDYEKGKPCKTILGNPLDGDYNISQKLKKYYYLHGAYFMNRVKPFLKNPSLYGKKWGAVFFEDEYHIDIDTPEDLLKAKKTAKELDLKI